jgi:hypothetical protein
VVEFDGEAAVGGMAADRADERGRGRRGASIVSSLACRPVTVTIRAGVFYSVRLIVDHAPSTGRTVTIQE